MLSSPELTQSGADPRPAPVSAMANSWTVARALAALTIGLAAVGLLGWVFDSALLRGLGNDRATMKVNTALMLLLTGLSVLHLSTRRQIPVVDRSIIAAILLIGGLSFAEYLLGVDLGIDQLLMADTVTGPEKVAGPPGRMSALTAFCGLLLGLGLAFVARRDYFVGQSLALCVGLMSYGSLLGHFFGVSSYYAFGQYSSISIHTSLALLSAAAGLLFLHPGRGLMQTVTNALPGGTMARYTGVYMLLAPPLLTILSFVLTNRAGFSSAAAASLLLLLFIFGTLLLLNRVSDRLNNTHEQVLEQLAQLQQSERYQEQQTSLLQNVVDNTQVGIGVMSAVRGADGAIIDFRWDITNEPNARITNLPVATMLGARMTDLLPGMLESEFFANCIRVVETGEPMAYEFPYFSDTVAGWLDITIVRQDDGILFSSLNITNRKQAELAVQKQAELLTTVIDTSTAGIILYRAVRDTDATEPDAEITDFEVVLANATGAQIVGRQLPDAFVGRRMSELLPSRDGREFFGQVASVVETGVSKAWLLPYFSDGIDGWFNMSIIRQDDQAVVTFSDVSDLKRLQEKLEFQNHELHRSNDHLQQFAYIASHDLQEPLRKIQSFGDILTTNYSTVLDETGRDMLRRMQSSAGRMSMLIKDLLAYSRLSTQREPFRQVALSDVMAQVLDDLDMTIQASGGQVTVDELPDVPGDGQQLQQLFHNLTTNALKFHRDGVAPRIRVSCRRIEVAGLPEEMQSPLLKSGSFYEISVADNGIGFEEKYLDRIFQVFQRLHGKTEFVGSGVGLAISKKVADNHNGGLTATSILNEGSTFRVYLPV